MSPRMTEHALAGPGDEGALRRFGMLATRALGRIAGRSERWMVLLDGDGAIAWRERGGPGVTRYPSFEAWALEQRDVEVTILLSSSLLHTLRLDEAIDDAVRAAREAAQRLLRYHGTPAAAWPVAVDDDGRFACALHGLAPEPLIAAAAARGIVLRGMVPLWSQTLERLTARLTAPRDDRPLRCLLVENELVTCLDLDADRLLDVQQRFLDAATPEALDALVGRLLAEQPGRASEVWIAGWGIPGTGGPRFPFGPLTASPIEASWLVGEQDLP